MATQQAESTWKRDEYLPIQKWIIGSGFMEPNATHAEQLQGEKGSIRMPEHK